MLAVLVTMEILSNSSSSAQSLLSSVEGADLSGLDLPDGGSVGDVNVIISDPSATPPPTTESEIRAVSSTPTPEATSAPTTAPSSGAPASGASQATSGASPATTPSPPPGSSNLAIIIAVAAGSLIVVSVLGALALLYFKRRNLKEKDLAAKLISAEAEVEPVHPSPDDVSEQEDVTASAEVALEPEEPQEPQWSDLSNVVSTMRFLSSDLVASYSTPAPMEPHVGGHIEAGAGLFNAEDYSRSVSIISLDQTELEERMMFTGEQPVAPSPMHSARNWSGLHSSKGFADHRSSEAVRAAGRAELERMKGRDVSTAPRSLRSSEEVATSEAPPKSSSWGLSLLLPTLPSIQWPEDGDQSTTYIITEQQDSGGASLGPMSSAAHLNDVAIDLGPLPSIQSDALTSYRPVPPSPDVIEPQSQQSSSVTSSAVRDRFRANLARTLQQAQKP